MKITSYLIPFVLALIAAIGNAVVTLGQKKATAYEHPFLFGAFSLLFASLVLFGISLFFSARNAAAYIAANIPWFMTTGSGLVLLNIFLYLLYREYGAAYYTLYAMLAIVTTSIVLAAWVFKESMNVYYWISLGMAALTIVFFLKGKAQ